MAKISKTKILNMLSTNLEVFFPDLTNHFMCPTCLTKIPLHEKNKISECHIIPKAAGGKLKTYLCTKCNSIFGTKQDKWFGEHVRLASKDKPKLLYTNIKQGYFHVDDIRVSGKWERGKNNEMIFNIYEDKNPPAIRKLMREKFKTQPKQVKLEVPFPIMGQNKFIEIGFLTAGYLMWFGSFGYSWVLQSHLEPFREQILNPEKEILKTLFIGYCNELRMKPWIGFVTLADEIVLTMGFENCLVIFPPADRPELSFKLGTDKSKLKVKDFRPISSPKPYYGEAACVAFDNRLLIAPDAMKKGNLSTVLIHFSSTRNDAIVASPISKEEYNRQKKGSNTILTHLSFKNEK